MKLFLDFESECSHCVWQHSAQIENLFDQHAIKNSICHICMQIIGQKLKPCASVAKNIIIENVH